VVALIYRLFLVVQMPTVKLTKDKIGKIKAPDPSGKQVIYWDEELAGFGLLVSGVTSSKSYIAQRRLPDGRTRRITIGAVNEFSKVEAARRELSGRCGISRATAIALCPRARLGA